MIGSPSVEEHDKSWWGGKGKKKFPLVFQLYTSYGRAGIVPLLSPCDGIAAVETLGPEILKVTDLAEKLALEEAPSNLGIDGRYILTPDIFALLEKVQPGKGGEIQVTDAIAMQARAGHCYSLKFTGIRYDTGTPLGLLTTSIAFALKRPDIGPESREYMRKALSKE